MEIKDRIKTARQYAKLSQEKLALSLGEAGQSTVGNWERGINKPDISKLERIAELCGVNQIWLVLGVGKMDGRAPEVKAQSGIDPLPETLPVPLIEARVNGGPGSEHDSEDVIGQGYVPRDWLERTGYRLSALKQVRVIGDSMAPKICDGDKVIINTDDAGRVDGAVYVVRVGDALRVKRLYSRMDRKAVELKSDATGTTELIDADAVRIIGRVVMLHREQFSI